MKPDWEDAPEWAQWLAMDRSGRWWFYEFVPRKGGDLWMPTEGDMEGGICKDWAETLEGRPE